MRKIYLLMFALMLCFSMANAQVIEGTVLKSWDGASGLSRFLPMLPR